MRIFCTILLLVLSSMASAKELSWKNLSLLYAKLHPELDYPKHVDDYLREFHPEEWNTYRNDEFLQKEKEARFSSEMRSLVAAYDKEELYTIRTSVTLGEYDFERDIFPLQEALSMNTYFHATPEEIPAYHRMQITFPYRYKLFLSNPSGVEGLRMKKEAARTFIESRKSKSGRVDRKVHLVLNVKVTDVHDELDDAFIGDIISYSFDTDR